MNVYLKGEKAPYTAEITPTELWDIHRLAVSGVLLASVKLTKGTVSFKSVRRIDRNRTFSKVILEAHASTIPPPPPLPREMDVYHDTLPSATEHDTDPSDSGEYPKVTVESDNG